MRRADIHYCIECGSILPDRYKGRQKKYCNNNCRKVYTMRLASISGDQKQQDLRGRRNEGESCSDGGCESRVSRY